MSSSVETDVADRMRGYVLHAIPGWSEPSRIAVKRLLGGVSNSIFRCDREVSSSEPQKGPNTVVVRVIGTGGNALVDRDAEVRLCVRMGSAGRSPEVFGVFNGGYVTEFIPGRSMNRDGCLVHRDDCARELARWHAVDCSETLGTPTLMLWNRVRDWIKLIRSFPNSEKHDWQAAADALEAELDPLAEHLSGVQEKLVGTALPPVVICHNDVNPTNIMADDIDPEKGIPRNPKRPVVFIDLEYAFYNNPLFDVAHHFLDMGGMELDQTLVPNSEWQHAFMRTYLTQWQTDHAESSHAVDDATIEKILRAAKNWQLAVHYFWAVWAMASTGLAEQNGTSDDDFDPYDFAQLRLDRYVETRVSLGLPPSKLRAFTHNPEKWPATA